MWLTCGQVVPGLVGRKVWSCGYLASLSLGESGIKEVLVELGHLLQGDGSGEGLRRSSMRGVRWGWLLGGRWSLRLGCRLVLLWWGFGLSLGNNGGGRERKGGMWDLGGVRSLGGGVGKGGLGVGSHRSGIRGLNVGLEVSLRRDRRLCARLQLILGLVQHHGWARDLW